MSIVLIFFFSSLILAEHIGFPIWEGNSQSKDWPSDMTKPLIGKDKSLIVKYPLTITKGIPTNTEEIKVEMINVSFTNNASIEMSVSILPRISKINISFMEASFILVYWEINEFGTGNIKNQTERIDIKGKEEILNIYADWNKDQFSFNLKSENMDFAMNDSDFKMRFDQEYEPFAVEMSVQNVLPSSALRFSSIKINGQIDNLDCSSEQTCSGHGICLLNPSVNDSSSLTSSRCYCHYGYNGTNCENFYGFEPQTLVLYRAQSLSTDENNHLENIFEMGNVNLAPAKYDTTYACRLMPSYGVTQYTFQVDPSFKEYEPFNQGKSFSQSIDKRVGSANDMYYSFPQESQCKPCDLIGTNDCRWKIISVDKIVESQCIVDYGLGNMSSCDRIPESLCCEEKFPESFYNCSAVPMDSSKEWIKGFNRPAHCPRVISGCVGETFSFKRIFRFWMFS
jgi:hypothetical protein